MAAQTPITPESQEIARLKQQYWTALNRRYETQITETDSLQNKRIKLRNQARERENTAFQERLRDRLASLGVKKEDLGKIGEELNKAQQEPMFRAPAVKRLAQRRTAMLVIHGIGEQNPYETLDQFSRNLMRYLSNEGGIDDLEISAARYDHNDSIEARIRLSTEKFGPAPDQPGLIDVYEYYWAPETEDKISYKETLSWLIRTTLTPLRLLNENVQAISEAEKRGEGENTGEDDGELLSRGAIFRREIRRIILIYLPLLFLLGSLSYLLPKATELPATLQHIFKTWTTDHPWAKAIMTCFFIFALAINYVVIRQLWKNWLRRMRRQSAIVKTQWVWQTFLIGLVFTFAGLGVGWLRSVSLSQYFWPLYQLNVLAILFGAGVAKVIQLFLANFVGDVAVYTNINAKAKNFQVRKAILAGSTTALIRLLREANVAESQQTYDQVIVAGHSLGSVIAYDTLNQLLNKGSSRPDQIVNHVPAATGIDQDDLKKISALITFGSPLDKVYYFFRENVSQHQAVRAQLLQFLQSFKKRPSSLDYGVYRFQRYDASGLDGVTWLNAWSKQDPVSGALHFYTGLKRREFDYKIPIYAHLSYWEDLRFYEFFAEPLLLGNQPALLQKAMGASV